MTHTEQRYYAELALDPTATDDDSTDVAVVRYAADVDEFGEVAYLGTGTLVMGPVPTTVAVDSDEAEHESLVAADAILHATGWRPGGPGQTWQWIALDTAMVAPCADPQEG